MKVIHKSKPYTRGDTHVDMWYMASHRQVCRVVNLKPLKMTMRVV